MEVELESRFNKRVRMDRDIERTCLMPEAVKLKNHLKETTRRRTGRTAASTRIEGGHFNEDRNRRAVRVLQSYGAVPMNWRTEHDYMVRAATGG